MLYSFKLCPAREGSSLFCFSAVLLDFECLGHRRLAKLGTTCWPGVYKMSPEGQINGTIRLTSRMATWLDLDGQNTTRGLLEEQPYSIVEPLLKTTRDFICQKYGEFQPSDCRCCFCCLMGYLTQIRRKLGNVL